MLGRIQALKGFCHKPKTELISSRTRGDTELLSACHKERWVRREEVPFPFQWLCPSSSVTRCSVTMQLPLKSQDSSVLAGEILEREIGGGEDFVCVFVLLEGCLGRGSAGGRELNSISDSRNVQELLFWLCTGCMCVQCSAS